MPLSPITVYDLDDPRKKIEDTFTIDALDDRQFLLRLAKSVVEHDDGTIQERAYATMEEAMSDPIAPGYEYGYTPVVKSAQEIPVLRHGEPIVFRSLEEVIARLFAIVCFVLGAIAAIVLAWSALMWRLKKDHRARYRRRILFSILAFAVIIGFYLVGYFILQPVCCVILGE